MANLVAAAVIYLMGTLAGVLPRSPYLIFTSVTVLLMGLAYCLTVLGIVMRGQTRTYVIGTAMIMLGVSLIGAPFIRTSGITWPEKVTMPVAGVICVWLGVTAVLDTRRQRHRPAAQPK